jgi:alpha-ketoglutarate-dependent taurine dioxygenase
MPSALGPVHFREIVAKDAGPPRYRLNIEEIERWGAITEPGLTSAHRRTLTDLSSALHAVSTTVVLEPTDLLILDNWRVCHGRPELPKRSGRRLERVWVADARA